MPNKTLLLRVTGATGCRVVRPGDRWQISGCEVCSVDGARLCLHAIHQFHSKLVGLPSDSSAATLVLHCKQTGCNASFLAEWSDTSEGPDSDGVTRRLESAALKASKKLRTAGTFMSRLTSALALEVVAVAGRRQGEAGTEFLPSGVRGERLYIVADGSVEVVRPSTEHRAETILAVLGPGDCFGEMSLLTDQVTSASVRARSACSLFTLTRPQLEQLLNGSPELARVFSQLLAERLSTLNRTLEGEMERGMRGQLATLPFADLVQLLHAGRRTGTVFLNASGHEARLGFQDGRLVAAESGATSGEAVFFELVNWPEGEFRLERDLEPFPEPARIQTDTLALLMEALRRMDEAPSSE